MTFFHTIEIDMNYDSDLKRLKCVSQYGVIKALE